ncbi:MAG: restriction endonuclease subunit S [Malacoplasma sp.]
MKKTGIDWIGDIPSDWQIIKTKHLVDIKTGRKDANEGSKDGIYPFFTCSMEDKKIDSYSFDMEALLVAGNGVVGHTKYYKGKFDAYQRIYVLGNFSEIINPIFMKYYFNVLLPPKLSIDKVGSVIDFIKLGDLMNFYIAFPLLKEQEKIVNYLDKKVSKINETIDENEKLVKLLEEYKLSIISDTFNKLKLNSEILKLKKLGNLQNGISASAEKFGTGIGLFINYGDVYNNLVLPNHPSGKIDITKQEAQLYSLKYQDILFTRTSETIDEIGISSVCLEDYENSAFSGFLIRFRPKEKIYMNPDFYKYYFKMREHRDYFAKEMNIVTRASLSQGLLGNLDVVYPSKEIQDKTSLELDKKMKNLEKSIKYRKSIINKLEEYKKSLIYEVITGKVEV